MNKRAVIYARVSTDKQRGNYSIPSQIAECLRYATNKGYSVIGDRFVDPKTGKDVVGANGAIPAYVDDHSSLELNRPGLDAVYDYLETHGFDVVIVYSIDRLDRDPYKLRVHEYGFIRLGASVEFVNGEYSDTPEGRFMKNVVASAAQLENDWRTERFTRGKRRKAKNGKFVGGRAPYGYYTDEEALGGLSIDKEQAEVIRDIYNYFIVDSYSIRGIAEVLNEKGDIRPPLSKRWGKSTIHRILTNPAYIGNLYFNKSKKSGRGPKEKGRKDRERSEWIKISIPSIIDEQTFNNAKYKLELNRKALRKQPARDYLLSGMIFCEDCGKAYYSQTRKAGSQRRANDAPEYRHRKSHGHCRNHQISARKLEPLVWNNIVNLLLNPESLRQGYEEALKIEHEDQSKQRILLEEYYRAIDKLEQRRKNLVKAYTDPDLGILKSDFLEQKSAIDKEYGNIENLITETKTQLSNLPLPEELESLERFAEEIKLRITRTDWEPSLSNKCQILKLLNVKVILDKNGTGKILGWFGEIPDLLSITS